MGVMVALSCALLLQTPSQPTSPRDVNYTLEFLRDPSEGQIDADVTLRWTYRRGGALNQLYFVLDPELGGNRVVSPLRLTRCQLDDTPAIMVPVEPARVYRVDLPKPLFPGHVTTLKFRLSYRIEGLSQSSVLLDFFPQLAYRRHDQWLIDRHQRWVRAFGTVNLRFNQPSMHPMLIPLRADPLSDGFLAQDVMSVAIAFGSERVEHRLNGFRLLDARSDGRRSEVQTLIRRLDAVGLIRPGSMVLVDGPDVQFGGVAAITGPAEQSDTLLRALLGRFGLMLNDGELGAWRQVLELDDGDAWLLQSANPFRDPVHSPALGIKQVLIRELPRKRVAEWAGRALLGRLRPITTEELLVELGRVPQALDVQAVSLLRDDGGYRVTWEGARPGAFIAVGMLDGEIYTMVCDAQAGSRVFGAAQIATNLATGFDFGRGRSLPVPQRMQRLHRHAQTGSDWLGEQWRRGLMR